MVALRYTGLAMCLALVPLFGASQAQKPERGSGWGWNTQDQKARLHAEVLGFWELTHLSGEGSAFAGADLKGYLLFAPDYFAFEYHFREPTEIRGLDNTYFQSGIHKYRFDGMGRMETSSMIGSSGGDDVGGLEFEEPGRARAFMIELAGDHLVLAHTFSRFEFRRIATTPYTDLEPGVNFDDRLPENRPGADGE